MAPDHVRLSLQLAERNPPSHHRKKHNPPVTRSTAPTCIPPLRATVNQPLRLLHRASVFLHHHTTPAVGPYRNRNPHYCITSETPLQRHKRDLLQPTRAPLRRSRATIVMLTSGRRHSRAPRARTCHFRTIVEPLLCFHRCPLCQPPLLLRRFRSTRSSNSIHLYRELGNHHTSSIFLLHRERNHGHYDASIPATASESRRDLPQTRTPSI
ncbi:hypothetical protein DEO72_LG2g3226 [Vigna unguiculata]|uniref:Uncharacterized protein n=1 Tax=Vigna unguiculata TaxID=3917 RepID=A0A4D6L352_VIGUN|nr:hypothetical protein DEO72_LG2g3226 [Vigna unguiculata]